jgi:1-acyl-sn-glycerol-3-phosphate acyltransferase
MQLKYALKKRVERACYSLAKKFATKKAEGYFNVSVNGIENIPESSAILAFNHTFGLDGAFTCMHLPKQVHQLIQFEGVYNKKFKNRLYGWAVGFIPVSVGEIDEQNKITNINERVNLRAMTRARDYLKSYNDFIGIFIDGPACRLYSPDGKILKKNQRTASESAAMLSIITKKPIVPIGLWMPEPIAEKLWEFGYDKEKENTEYIQKRKAELILKNYDFLIPYQINIGQPIYPENLDCPKKEKRQKLTELVKSEIVRLSEKQ